jgi:formylglycine-generating enzyme required for sulfatase activity
MNHRKVLALALTGALTGALLVWPACSSEEFLPGSDSSGPAPGSDAAIVTDGPLAPEHDGNPPPQPDSAIPSFKVPGTWITIKGGSFTMGSPTDEYCRDSDETAHQVVLTSSFQITSTEVTQDQFKLVRGYNPAYHAACGGNCPVEWVSWHEAAAYCNTLSQAEARPTCYICSSGGPQVTCKPATTSNSKISSCKGYRLPTEAEWEYAARAGTSSALASGEILSCMGKCSNAAKIAWFKSTSTGVVHGTAQLDPNPWKLYDMSGNVYEWTNDWYQADPGTGQATDPTGPSGGKEKVFRGGAWYFNAEHARSANRERFDPAKRFTYLGFRCVRTL